MTKLAEVGSKGVQGVGTPDLHIDGLGKVEVFTPKSLKLDSLIRNLEDKKYQAPMFQIQANISAGEMKVIAERLWGKPNCQHIVFLFFEPGTGKILTFKKN